MARFSRFALPLALLPLAAGCYQTTWGLRWQRVEPTPQALPDHKLVRVWSHSQVVVWRGVASGADSVSGIPYRKPAVCHHCRVSLPRADVDSVLRGDVTTGRAVIAGLLLTTILVYTFDPNIR